MLVFYPVKIIKEFSDYALVNLKLRDGSSLDITISKDIIKEKSGVQVLPFKVKYGMASVVNHPTLFCPSNKIIDCD
jgi:hypothetical protein